MDECLALLAFSAIAICYSYSYAIAIAICGIMYCMISICVIRQREEKQQHQRMKAAAQKDRHAARAALLKEWDDSQQQERIVTATAMSPMSTNLTQQQSDEVERQHHERMTVTVQREWDDSRRRGQDLTVKRLRLVIRKEGEWGKRLHNVQREAEEMLAALKVRSQRLEDVVQTEWELSRGLGQVLTVKRLCAALQEKGVLGPVLQQEAKGMLAALRIGSANDCLAQADGMEAAGEFEVAHEMVMEASLLFGRSRTDISARQLRLMAAMKTERAAAHATPGHRAPVPHHVSADQVPDNEMPAACARGAERSSGAVQFAMATVFAAVAAVFATVAAHSLRAYLLCRGWLQRMHNNIRRVAWSRPCSYWVFVAWICVSFVSITAPLVVPGHMAAAVLGGVNVLVPVAAGYRWTDTVREILDAVMTDLRCRRTSSGDSKAFEAEPPIEYKCPISCDIMVDPVVASDGWTYDRACIENWLHGSHNVEAVAPVAGGGGTHASRGWDASQVAHNTSPMTNEVMESNRLVPNNLVRNLIRTWTDAHDDDENMRR
jgi:hypothetical protein